VSVRILVGDALAQLQTLPDESVQCCVTSPPYYGLRDYGHSEQIGLEKTPQLYVEKLVGVCREVRRVLRDDGTLWLNIGDSYAGSGMTGGTKSKDGGASRTARMFHGNRRDTTAGCKPKDLIGIPWMVAFALRADGWYLRSDIIWAKPNPMPESVTDRPTKSHEYLFLLAKSERYYYDHRAIQEPMAEASAGRYAYAFGGAKNERLIETDNQTAVVGHRDITAGRNKRTVWTVNTQSYSGAHFATFPPSLIKPCILAGSPALCCKVCGKAYRPERMPMFEASLPALTLGYSSECDCRDYPIPSTILDPFAGAGTTGLVADRLGRDAILIELNPSYADMARKRITNDAPLFAEESS
jgi:DNA modification methylase